MKKLIVTSLFLLLSTIPAWADRTGTRVASPVTVGSSANTFPAAYQDEIQGGAHSVADLTARDAIPAARRVEGMTAFVISEGVSYRLEGGITNSDWVVDTTTAAGSTTQVQVNVDGEFYADDTLTHDAVTGTTTMNMGNFIQGELRIRDTSYGGYIDFNDSAELGRIRFGSYGNLLNQWFDIDFEEASGEAQFSSTVVDKFNFGSIGLSSAGIGDIGVGNFNGGTGASSSTYWRGDGTWSTPTGGSSFTTSAELAALISDEVGSSSGFAVFNNAPTFQTSLTVPKLIGTTFGEYIDFDVGGDDVITLGGTAGTGNSTLSVVLDGTVTLIPLSTVNLLQVNTAYASSAGLNVKGRMAVGDTALSSTAQLNVLNTAISTSSAEKAINADITNAGSGGVTGLSSITTKTGAGGSSSMNGINVTSNFSGTSGTQTLLRGVTTGISQSGVGGTVTTGYGVSINASAVSNGTMGTYYGVFTQKATVSGGGVVTNNWALGVAGNVKDAGVSPTMSACGTSPTVAGGSFGGKITVGTGTVTSCTATFSLAFPSAPSCVVTGDQTNLTYGATTSTTALVITSSADMASDVISYICVGV